MREVLELPVVRRALPEVVAGDGGLDRDLRWAHVVDTADPSGLLKGGELVLTTGIGAGARDADQARWIAGVLEQGVAAVAVELGTTWRERVPEPVVAACRDAGVPLVAFRRQVRFIEITEAVHAAVLHRQFELLRRGEEIHRRFTELILQGRGVPEIMAELADAVGDPVVLEDAAHELVYYVSGPAGDDVALSAWADLHRAEDRGEAPEGALVVDVRLMDTSWGRLIALALDEPLDEFDRVAVERAAIAVAIDLLGRQHEEHLRARSRGAFLSDLAAGGVEEADARRRAEALGWSGGSDRRGALLPLAAAWRVPRARWQQAGDPAPGQRPSWTQLSGDLRSALASLGAGVLLGPRDVDLLVLVALGGREYDESLAEHLAEVFHGVLERRGLGPDDVALAIGAPAATWALAGQGLRRVRRSAGAATALAPARWYDARRPGVADLLHDLREAPELDAFVDEQLGPLLADGNARTRALLETLEAYLAAGGRKAQAARALHLERQSLYLRLRRIEELLGVSLEDEDAVLGLHLAVRALRFRRRRAA
ncbi:MAG: PucR family transcriptional regulator, purine catabolism regulatory protein [Solirubrobacteraceae bacterium]|nr:PucR family transcriptional regulator, purine catabolism regulatory protein [Solirubrobacteraceae bacterium]